MEVNISAFIATALFILIPTAFLLILYVRTAGQNNWYKRGEFIDKGASEGGKIENNSYYFSVFLPSPGH